VQWDAGSVVDFAVWAISCLVEVEPDVVLSTYMNAERNPTPSIDCSYADRDLTAVAPPENLPNKLVTGIRLW